MGSSHHSEPSGESTCKDDVDCDAFFARDAAALSVHATDKSSVTGDAPDAILASQVVLGPSYSLD